MKMAIYCRVSTDKQSHDSQLLELRGYCQRRGWGDVVEYSDTITRSKFTRRGLDALFADVRKGKVERIVVFKLDRLASFPKAACPGDCHD
jgi:DNA invertase Pin-like site-specific DNA recombinase